MGDHKNFSKDMTIDQILEKMDKSGANTEMIHAGPCFLQYRLHQELMSEQNKMHSDLIEEQRNFQSKYLTRTTWLVIGTWGLVLVTFFLVLKK